jgi:hypothetical protein
MLPIDITFNILRNNDDDVHVNLENTLPMAFKYHHENLLLFLPVGLSIILRIPSKVTTRNNHV